MRHDKAEDLIRLILRMQGTPAGLSLDDIEAQFEVSRRTAERMRDAVVRLFPDAEVWVDPERRKHTRITRRVSHELLRWEPAELAALEAAIEQSERDGHSGQSKLLRELAVKLSALIKSRSMARIAPDLEGLCEGQGMVMRPGPRPAGDPEVLESLRYAILAGRRVVLDYRPRLAAKSRPSKVHPYGFLCGHGHYLIGYSERGRKLHHYRIESIAEVTVCDDGFERDERFDLRAFAEGSFGVFQEEPSDVVWRFRPEVAEEALEFEFHPSQKTQRLEDGSLLVRFRAGGRLEMAWHLFRWGPGVEILEPEGLREQLLELLTQALEAHAAPDRQDAEPTS
ncbi:MAG: WYL domain-containing protein [Deltaproteobacteria bacterium]|nr:WYL domain-containing protein [Deltaproteobacteria bacterium]